MRRKSGLTFPLWMIALIAIPATAAAQAEDTAVEDAAAEEAPAADEVERFVVTGTRIKRKEVSTAAPVTVVTREEMLRTGIVSVGEILQRLSSQGNAINVQFNNGGNGTATVNLRLLGANRTLVLLNGRRHVTGGNGANASVDLNSIPITIIERVEVLKDGASAVYGSDAVGGVVNIVTRKDFVGVEANAYSGISQRNDGANYQLDLTTGLTTEKGNIVAAVTFFDQQPIFAGERFFSEDARAIDWDEWVAAGQPSSINRDEDFIFPLGSSSTPQGRVNTGTSTFGGNAAYDASGCNQGTLCYNDADDGWRRWAGSTDTYNFQPENYLSTPNRRFNFFTQGNYEINEYVSTFFELSFTDRRASLLLAPTPLFLGGEGITVSADNIYNPFGRDFTDARRRLLEVGNRVTNLNSRTSRIVVGLQGELPDVGFFEDWSWDIYGNFGRTDTTQVQEGLLNGDRLAQALGPDSECTGDCVPFDIFGGAGSITQEMTDYVASTVISRGFNDQQIYAVNLGGPLFEIVPDNPVGLALGYQYRREAGGNIPDPLTATGTIIGNSRDPVKGKFDVNAFFAELSAPLAEDMPGIEFLEFNAAVRFVDFSTAGSDQAFKLGLRWQITPFLAARGTYSTAYRAPSVGELFSGAVDGFPNVVDPCSAINGRLDNPNVAARCEDEGLAAGSLDDRTQLLSVGGGNAELEPETATTITAGLVLSEDLVPGLSVNVDFFNIEVEDAITTIGASTILSSCYDADPGERQFCELVNRNANGLIDNLTDTLVNVGGINTTGVDAEIRYSLPSEFGRFGATLEGTYLIDYTQIQADGFEQDLTGTFTDNDGFPEIRLRSQLVWMLDNYNVGVNLRYVGAYDECADGGPGNYSSAPCTTAGSLESDTLLTREIPQYLAGDIYAGVNFESGLDGLGTTAITLGINNVGDATPPFIASGFLAESDASTYDYVGRFFYARLSQRF
ncbi:MAG: TonB-dependent receptor [Myxococcota bacterium]